MSDIYGLSAEDFRYLNITQTPLGVKINGGNARVVGYNQILKMNAGDETYDPDIDEKSNKTGMVFQWKCRKSTENYDTTIPIICIKLMIGNILSLPDGKCCQNNGVTTEKCIKLMIGNILSLPDGKCCQNNGMMTKKCIKLMIGNILSLPDGKCWWITFYYKYFLFKCCNPCILRNCQFKYIVIGGGQDIDEPESIEKSKWIALESFAEINCKVSQNVNYDWNIYKINQGVTYQDYTFEAYPIDGSVIRNKFNLDFPPRIFESGHYRISLNVSMSDIYGLSAEDFRYLNITQTPLGVKINGGNARVVGYNQMLTVKVEFLRYIC
jgi:hypothetical protein